MNAAQRPVPTAKTARADELFASKSLSRRNRRSGANVQLAKFTGQKSTTRSTTIIEQSA
jgi:hypothetical protein